MFALNMFALHMFALHMPALHMPALHMPALHTYMQRPVLLVYRAVQKAEGLKKHALAKR